MMLHNQSAVSAPCHMIVVMTNDSLIRRSGGGAYSAQHAASSIDHRSRATMRDLWFSLMRRYLTQQES